MLSLLLTIRPTAIPTHRRLYRLLEAPRYVRCVDVFCYSVALIRGRELVSMASTKTRPVRDNFRYFVSIPTRWMDNDVYGHVNNVVYYAYFDTAICRYLMVEAGIDIVNGPTLPFTVENGCRYHHSLAFPQVLEAGLGVAHLGTSSVRYEIALFPQDQQDAAADGYFVDVFVDRGTHRSVPIPPKARAALEKIVMDQRGD